MGNRPGRADGEEEEFRRADRDQLRRQRQALAGEVDGVHRTAESYIARGADLGGVPNGLISYMGHASLVDISFNDIVELPAQFAGLSAMKELLAHDNRIQELPDPFGNLYNLRGCDLSRNALEYLPDSIGRLGKLRTLRLSQNELVAIPDSIGDLKALEVLDLRHNHLTSLPESITRLESLTVLTVEYNQLRQLPSNLHRCEKLVQVHAAFNYIESVPPASLAELEFLRSVTLHNNRIGQPMQPSLLEELPSLTNLSLHNNNISLLPNTFSGDLRLLRARRRDLELLPADLAGGTAGDQGSQPRGDGQAAAAAEMDIFAASPPGGVAASWFDGDVLYGPGDGISGRQLTVHHIRIACAHTHHEADANELDEARRRGQARAQMTEMQLDALAAGEGEAHLSDDDDDKRGDGGGKKKSKAPVDESAAAGLMAAELARSKAALAAKKAKEQKKQSVSAAAARRVAEQRDADKRKAGARVKARKDAKGGGKGNPAAAGGGGGGGGVGGDSAGARYLGQHENVMLTGDLGDGLTVEMTNVEAVKSEQAGQWLVAAQVPQLRTLSLQQNGLLFLPDSFAGFFHLKVLDISRNKLMSLPEALCATCPLLEMLDCHDNELDLLPTSIGQLQSLQLLRIDGNDIRRLPPTFNTLGSLRVLRMGKNKRFRRFPEDFFQSDSTRGLMVLDVMDIPGIVIPDEIRRLRRLKKIRLLRRVLQGLPKDTKKALEGGRLELQFH